MKRLLITAAVGGMLAGGALLMPAHANTLPSDIAGNNCTATMATGPCTFTAPPATPAPHATGFISEGMGKIAPPAGSTSCNITAGPPTGPLPTLPTPNSYTLNADGSATVTGPGANSLSYVPGCVYTVTATVGAIEGGTIS